MAVDPEGPILVLSPHLDDAVIDCWTVLRGSAGVTVVTVCAGTPPAGAPEYWQRLAGASDAAQRMSERREEDRAALALADAVPIHLSFLEHASRKGPPPAFSTIDAALTERVPVVRLLYAPAVLGTVHPDHVLVRDYALRLARQGVPLQLYADMPYATAYGWPPWVTGEPPDPFLDVDGYWRNGKTDPALVDRDHARVVRLDHEQAAAKLTAIRRYRTQFSMLDRGPIGMLSNPAIHAYETYWSVDRRRAG